MQNRLVIVTLGLGFIYYINKHVIKPNKVVEDPYKKGFLQPEPKLIFNKNPNQIISNLQNHKINHWKSAKNIYLCSEKNLDFTIRIRNNNDIEFSLISGNKQEFNHLITKIIS